MITDNTSRQMRAAELIRQGVPETQAYEMAGYSKTSAKKKYRLRMLKPIAEALAYVEPSKLAFEAYTLEKAMLQAQYAIDFAIEHENPNALVKATELKCKLAGLLVDRVEVVALDLRGALARAAARFASIVPTTPLLEDGSNGTTN